MWEKMLNGNLFGNWVVIGVNMGMPEGVSKTFSMLASFLCIVCMVIGAVWILISSIYLYFAHKSRENEKYEKIKWAKKQIMISVVLLSLTILINISLVIASAVLQNNLGS